MERRNLESAAAVYAYLRGLLAVPVGVLMAASGLGNMAWGPFSTPWTFFVVLAVAAAGYLAAHRYYVRNFGRIIPSGRVQAEAVAATAVSAVVVVGAVQADWSFDLPVSLTAAAFALILFAYHAIGVGRSVRQAVTCGALLAAGLAPVWGDAAAGTKINVGLVLTGAAVVVTGLFDHLAFRRVFGPAGDPASADA